MHLLVTIYLGFITVCGELSWKAANNEVGTTMSDKSDLKNTELNKPSFSSTSFPTSTLKELSSASDEQKSNKIVTQASWMTTSKQKTLSNKDATILTEIKRSDASKESDGTKTNINSLTIKPPDEPGVSDMTKTSKGTQHDTRSSDKKSITEGIKDSLSTREPFKDNKRHTNAHSSDMQMNQKEIRPLISKTPKSDEKTEQTKLNRDMTDTIRSSTNLPRKQEAIKTKQTSRSDETSPTWTIKQRAATSKLHTTPSTTPTAKGSKPVTKASANETNPLTTTTKEKKPVTTTTTKEKKPVTTTTTKLMKSMTPMTTTTATTKNPVTTATTKEMKPMTITTTEKKPVTPTTKEMKPMTTTTTEKKPITPTTKEMKPMTTTTTEKKPITPTTKEMKPMTTTTTEKKPVTTTMAMTRKPITTTRTTARKPMTTRTILKQTGNSVRKIKVKRQRKRKKKVSKIQPRIQVHRIYPQRPVPMLLSPAGRPDVKKKKKVNKKGANRVQGARGPKGEKGDKGERGPPGPPANATEDLPQLKLQAAATAVLTDHFGPDKDVIIPFDLKLMDLADNYDNSSGVFMTSIPGIYVISLYLMSHPGAKVNARIFINNRPVAALWADDSKNAGFYPSSSIQTISKLSFGDQVYVMLVDGGYGESWVHANYNAFTLYLLYEEVFF